MNDQVEMMKILREFIVFKSNDIKYAEVENISISFTSLRDRIIGIGKILYENFESQIYVVSVNSGVANMNEAVIVIKLCGDRILLLGYANEGTIRQHTAQKALSKVIKLLNI